MENDIFSAALPVANQNVMSLEEVSSHILSGPVHHDALGTNSERHMMAGYPMFSALQEEGIRNLHINNEGSGVNPEVVASRYTSLTCNPFTNDDLNQHFMDNSLSATSITNLLSMSTNVPGNIRSAIPSVADLPTDEIRSFFSNNSGSNFNAAFSASQNCAYGAQDDVEYLAPKRDLNMDGQILRWDCNEMAAHQLLLGRAMTTVRPSYHVLSSADATWIPTKTAPNSGDQFTYCAPSNELSLTLGSSQLSIMNIPSIPDQCSEISCSGITQATSKDNRCQDAPEMHDPHLLRRPINDIALGMGLEMRHTFCGSDDLSLDCGSSSHIHFSHMLLTSRYLHVAQQILAEVTSYALENHAERDDSLEGIGNEGRGTFSPSSYGEKGASPADADELRYPSWDPKSQGHMDLLLQRHAPKTKKTELITMLQMIDQGFGKCMEQIQNVANAFREATNSGPSLLPGRFALHTISVFYRALRERIAAQILVVSQHLGSEYLLEKEKSFESSFIQKQWALQQLRRNDHQSWRPQRGLPEKSVAVLRAWMFQNFLHPYPKDSEKQLLAIKSGLTRSQVSNWFINARVRLWKPMIEEMYSEISRKNRGGEEGTAGERRNDGNGGSQRARMN